MVADSLQKSLKDSTGVDHLEIRTNDVGDADSQRVNVTVGTDLSREITVKYGVDVRNGETVQRVTTDYKLLETLLMSGYQDTGGNFGGELKYRMEFR
jgi:translocation and assembly module TamB